MKVKCIKVTDAFGGGDLGKTNGWYSINNCYYILSINIDLRSNQVSYIRIESDRNQQPIMISIANFEFLDCVIPFNFGFYFDKEKLSIKLEPRSWHEYKSTRENWADFWDDYFDHERSAIELYRKEVAFIKGEDYEPLPPTKPDAKELLEIYRRRERDGLIPEQGFNKNFEPTALTSTTEWRK